MIFEARSRKIEGSLSAHRVIKGITHIGKLKALVERHFDCQLRILRCLSLNYRKDVRDLRGAFGFKLVWVIQYNKTGTLV